MRISAKGRYALAAMIEIAAQTSQDTTISVLEISNTLNISKIYLEQVFAQLKKNSLILSIKGARGGYRLNLPPSQITVWDILATQETSLVEKTEPTVADSSPDMEMTLQNIVFVPLEESIQNCLTSISLQDLLEDTQKQKFDQSFMLNM